MKIRTPTPQRFVDVIHNIFQWYTSQLSAGHVCQTVFDLLQGLPGGLHVGVSATGSPAPDYTDFKTEEIEATLRCIYDLNPFCRFQRTHPKLPVL